MWYVIYTCVGYEQELAVRLVESLDHESCMECLVPIYEDVKRSGGVSRISYKKLFPGYVLIDTEHPENVWIKLRNIDNYARMLGVGRTEDGEKLEEEEIQFFEKVSSDDVEFLHSILDDGTMRVSYVENVRENEIGRVIGPLAKYRKNIKKIEFRKRRAIVETEVFGKYRKIRFGLWTDEDPIIPWIEEMRDTSAGETRGNIGFDVGDRVIDISGIFGNQELVVESINPVQRKFTTRIMMLGDMRSIEIHVDNVKRVG